MAVLSQNPEGNHWLLIGRQNEKETVAYANGEVRDSSKATAVMPTLTRHNRGNATVSNERIVQENRSVNPYDTRKGFISLKKADALHQSIGFFWKGRIK